MEQQKRDGIPNEYKWRIEDLYASDAEWEKDFETVFRSIPDMERFRGRLSDADNLLAALEAASETGRRLERLYIYSHMKKDEDNSVTRYQEMNDRMVSLSVSLETTTAYITPEILAVPEEDLLGFIEKSSGLKVYEFMLKDLLRSKKHVLDEPREQLLAQVSELDEANSNTFSMLDHVDMRFGEIEEDGETSALTHGKYTAIMLGKNRALRKTAFKQYYAKYSENKNTLASVLTTNIKSDVFFAKARSYDCALHSALHSDNVPISVYDNLISVVRGNIGALHEYMSLKKQALGVDELHMYDVYAPVTSYDEPEIAFEETRQILLAALEPLGDEYLELLNRAYDEGWMDVYESFGKTSGAYCTGAYGVHPFVLLNYQNKLEDVYTIAHELGHAMHSHYSDTALPYPKAQYKIFVAEVASTVNEVLLTSYLLKTKDNARRASILNHYLEQFRGTFFRQTMFAEFEKTTHALIEEDTPLNAKRYMEIYSGLNEFYYGRDVVNDDEIKLEWARIPHFYRAFYVYKYATGFSAAVSIAKALLSRDKSALNGYISFLKSGGSDYPIELLKIAGADLSAPGPIEDCVLEFKKASDELRGLI